jgi:hypothetical protein
MRKEVDPQIYRILDEKGKARRFPKSSKRVFEYWTIPSLLKKIWIDDKRGQIVFCQIL